MKPKPSFGSKPQTASMLRTENPNPVNLTSDTASKPARASCERIHESSVQDDARASCERIHEFSVQDDRTALPSPRVLVYRTIVELQQMLRALRNGQVFDTHPNSDNARAKTIKNVITELYRHEKKYEQQFERTERKAQDSSPPAPTLFDQQLAEERQRVKDLAAKVEEHKAEVAQLQAKLDVRTNAL